MSSAERELQSNASFRRTLSLLPAETAAHVDETLAGVFSWPWPACSGSRRPRVCVSSSLTAILTWASPQPDESLVRLCPATLESACWAQFVLINRPGPLADPERTSQHDRARPCCSRPQIDWPTITAPRPRRPGLVGLGFPHGHSDGEPRPGPVCCPRTSSRSAFVLVAAPGLAMAAAPPSSTSMDRSTTGAPASPVLWDSPAKVEPLLEASISAASAAAISMQRYSLRIARLISARCTGSAWCAAVIAQTMFAGVPDPEQSRAQHDRRPHAMPGSRFSCWSTWSPGWKLMRRHFGKIAPSATFTSTGETWPGDETVQT